MPAIVLVGLALRLALFDLTASPLLLTELRFETICAFRGDLDLERSLMLPHWALSISDLGL